MQAALIPPLPKSPTRVETARKLWTRDECRRLMEQGFLEEGRFELIEGEIIYKVSQNEPHVYACIQVLKALVGLFGFDYVRQPAPVALSDFNEPEPDAAVTTKTATTYLETGTPEPRDMRLIVEVSDATLRRDKTTKARIYSAAGVADYWIINIKARTAIVHRQPGADRYGSIVTFSEDETISPLAAPDAKLRVGDLLPAQTTRTKPKRTAARK